MRVLVCGGREYGDQATLDRVLDPFEPEITMLIHGGATGADTLAGKWAKRKKIPQRVFRPDWKRYGRPAGRYRNHEMLREGKPDFVIAFPGGPGTWHMTMIAEDAGLRVIRVQ